MKCMLHTFWISKKPKTMFFKRYVTAPMKLQTCHFWCFASFFKTFTLLKDMFFLKVSAPKFSEHPLLPYPCVNAGTYIPYSGCLQLNLDPITKCFFYQCNHLIGCNWIYTQLQDVLLVPGTSEIPVLYCLTIIVWSNLRFIDPR
jgi:hypothetical protein